MRMNPRESPSNAKMKRTVPRRAVAVAHRTSPKAAPIGVACAGFARLCFTGVEPDRLDEGIDRINAVLVAVIP